MSTETQSNRRILVVDDNRSVQDDFRKILVPAGESLDLDAEAAALFGTADETVSEAFVVDFASQGKEALEKVQAAIESGRPYAMAFVDMRMPPGWDGVETILRIWGADKEIQVVLSTAYSDYSWDQIAHKLGTGDRLLILKKPFDPVEVRQLACSLTQKWDLARQARLKLGEMQTMVDDRTRQLQLEVQERRRSEAAAKLAQERFALAVAGANDGIWDWDLVENTVFYSPRWATMLGFAESEVSSSPDEWLRRIHPEDAQAVKTQIDRLTCGDAEQLCVEFRMQHRDASYRWMLCRGASVRNENGVVFRAAGSLTDVTDRKLAEDELRAAARIDKLTGLPNRALLLDRLQNAIERHKRLGSTKYAVLFLDFDRFKMVNDSLGHDVGDQLLCEIARRLEVAVRKVDSVSREASSSTASRLGGDEFVILLDGLREIQDAVLVAERILDAISAPFTLAGREMVITASIGIVTSDLGHELAKDILRDADTAMYEAKVAGKGRAVLFDEPMRTRVQLKVELENGLRHALEARHFALHYQPIVSLITGQVEGFETLIRWQHPQHGLIPPGDFIPVAEETGLIIPLGEWVFREACRRLSAWWKEFGRDAVPSISINLSRVQLSLPDLAQHLSEVAREEGVDPSGIHLEVTESAIMSDANHAIDMLHRIKAAGFKVDIDDFGTGYSSLANLHQFPIDVLKIDRSFVANLTRGREFAALVGAITILARNMNISVVAEGVETDNQLCMLQTLDCQSGQGYFFSRPLPAEQVAEYLRKPIEWLSHIAKSA